MAAASPKDDVSFNEQELKTAEQSVDESMMANVSVLENFHKFHSISGKALTDRSQTIAVTNALMGITENEDENVSSPFSSLSNVYGPGPLLVSDIPESCRRPVNADHNDGVVIGIDEAGRGSVLGPMVYGAAYWSLKDAQNVKKIANAGWTDSKKLNDAKRFDLMDNVILPTAEIGFVCRILPPNEISRNMTRQVAYNLNQMSHDTAITMIHKLIDAGVTNIDTCYIDTVGIAEHYQRKLEKEFQDHKIKFVVESKADDNYAPCSAASIVAKVVRDRVLEHWKFSESVELSKKVGSGYPSDPTCKKWMLDSIHPVFGFPDLVRFSWAPARKLLKENAVAVTFAADLDQEDDDDLEMSVNAQKHQRNQLHDFLNSSKKRKVMPFFQRRRLEVVTKL